MTEHNLALDEEQTMVLETVRKFATEVAGAHALERDEHGQYAEEGVSGLAELGLLGLPVSEDSGGAGMGMLSLALALVEIAKSCSSTAAVLGVQAGTCGKALEGLDSAAERFGPVAMGERVMAFVGPEHGLVATAKGEGFRLSGKAALAVAAARCEHLLVTATLAGAPILLECKRDGVVVDDVGALGFRAAASAGLSFDLTVDSGALVCEGEEAVQAVERGQIASWIAGAAIAVGLADASLAASRRHAAERFAFGKPLAKQQAVDRKLVQCQLQVDGARHFLYHAARRLDAGAPAKVEALQARISAVQAAVHTADEAIQIHGGFGYTVEYHVERHYRDAKVLEVLDGGIDAQLDLLSGLLDGGS